MTRIRYKDVTLALVSHCRSATGWPPVVYENKDDTQERPKIIFDHVRVGTTDRTIDGSAPVHRGYLILTVVVPLDEFVNRSEDIADQIADHFPHPLRLEVTGGKISGIKPAEVLNGFRDRDAGEWRVPVRFDYQAHTT